MNGAITKIRTELTNTFNRVLDVFAIREDILYFKPADEGWSIHEVIEHILLANYFLLRIVGKQMERLMQAEMSESVAHHEYKIDKNILERMQKSGSPMWVPQRFIEPTGEMPLLQLKMGLHDQLTQGMQLLQNEAAINAIVNESEHGKTDALHYICFLVQHMQRHLGQIERVRKEFDESQRQIEYGDWLAVPKSICLN